MTAADFRHLEIPQLATFEDGPGGLVRLKVTSPLANAEIYLHGAHVTHWQPAGAGPVLFMSAASVYAAGKPIRGGIPVIFPWFGPRAGHPGSPAHGFARTSVWEVESLVSPDERSVSVVLQLISNEATRALWPHDFVLRLRIDIGAQLVTALEVENTSGETFQFEDALHTYLSVADVRAVGVTGLENTPYIDKTDGLLRKVQNETPIRITSETDRVYLPTQTTCTVHDPGLGRRLVVEKTGSETTVVWNPWIAKAKAMADFGDNEWPGMICVETANAAEDAVTLPPGGKHTMVARVGVS